MYYVNGYFTVCLDELFIRARKVAQYLLLRTLAVHLQKIVFFCKVWLYAALLLNSF